MSDIYNIRFFINVENASSKFQGASKIVRMEQVRVEKKDNQEICRL